MEKFWQELDGLRGRIDPEAILTLLKKHKDDFTLEDHIAIIDRIAKSFGRVSAISPVPRTLVYAIRTLLKDRELGSICDPWAATGLLLQIIATQHKQSKVHAITQNTFEAELGNVLFPEAYWENSNPLSASALTGTRYDVVVSIMPFGVRAREKIILNDVMIGGDLDGQILCAYSLRLKEDGIGLFVVTPRFFLPNSAFQVLEQLGLCVDAAFELAAGTFAPITNMQSYLVVIKNADKDSLFVGKLSNNNKLNKQVLSNYLIGKESKNIDFGCYVQSENFRGLGAVRSEKEFARLKQEYEGSYYSLGEISDSVILGKSSEDFEFSDDQNAIFVPLIGKSDVVGSVEDMTLRLQNYAQIKIKQEIVNAEFVIRFLNSDIGVETRVENMSGITIRRLNKTSLLSLGVFVPKLEVQKSIIETSHKIRSQKNKLTSLTSELNECENKIWKDPSKLEDIVSEVNSIQTGTAHGINARSEQSLIEWIETLPFPLASILRAWYATSENDPKTKYEHLLHFFEGFSLFTGLIFLSAFRSNQTVYEEYKDGLAKVFVKNPIDHASFGTWKSMVEYFSKQTREKLSKEDEREVVKELFQDTSLALPIRLSDTRLIEIIAETNKYRNQWTGHGGVVGKEDAARRNELLVESLSKLRSLMGGLWDEIDLLTCESMRKKGQEYKNEVLVLMGSNSEFKTETRTMAMPLDEDTLYLHSKRNSQSLPLLPLIRMGSAPSSVKNACYFYNRISGEHAAKFVSYHYVDVPEIVDDHEETIEVIHSLSDLGH